MLSVDGGQKGDDRAPRDVRPTRPGADLWRRTDSDKAPGQERTYVAGEKEHEKEKSVREQGVPVNENLLLKLRIVGDELGIEGYEAYF
jgi:LDH2 family malate/lactate/ureidoglycolate dehydrogenase